MCFSKGPEHPEMEDQNNDWAFKFQVAFCFIYNVQVKML